MKNTTKIALIFFLFTSLISLGQKIKVKKNIISIDNTEIPIKVETSYRSNKSESFGDYDILYTFSNTNSSEIFVLVNSIGKVPAPNKPRENWLEISIPNNNKINAIDINFTGAKKGIIRYLLNELSFFNSDGKVNEANILAFIEKNTSSKAKTKAKGAAEKDASAKKLVNEIMPFVQGDMSITKGGRFGTEVIGSVISPDVYHETRNSPIEIYDLDENLIAIATTDILSPVIVNLIDGSRFNYKSKSKLDGTLTKQKFLTELVEKVVQKGFSLSNSYTDNKKEQIGEVLNDKTSKYELKKKNSSNIYNQKGYAIDEKGKRFEGEITMLFEQINNPNDVIGNNASNIGNGGIGSSLNIYYKNEKGKQKRQLISAKKNASFCVLNEEGLEICYKAIKVEGGPIINDSDGPMALASSKGKFLKEVFKEGDLIAYQYPPTKIFYLKMINKEKAFDFSIPLFGKKEKKAIKLKKYLDGCDYTDKNEYVEKAFEELSTIKKLINYYNTSCK